MPEKTENNQWHKGVVGILAFVGAIWLLVQVEKCSSRDAVEIFVPRQGSWMDKWNGRQVVLDEKGIKHDLIGGRRAHSKWGCKLIAGKAFMVHLCGSIPNESVGAWGLVVPCEECFPVPDPMK